MADTAVRYLLICSENFEIFSKNHPCLFYFTFVPVGVCTSVTMPKMKYTAYAFLKISENFQYTHF